MKINEVFEKAVGSMVSEIFSYLSEDICRLVPLYSEECDSNDVEESSTVISKVQGPLSLRILVLEDFEFFMVLCEFKLVKEYIRESCDTESSLLGHIMNICVRAAQITLEKVSMTNYAAN